MRTSLFSPFTGPFLRIDCFSGSSFSKHQRFRHSSTIAAKMFLIATLIAVSGEKPFRTSLETALKLFAAHQFPEPSARGGGQDCHALGRSGSAPCYGSAPGIQPCQRKMTDK